MAIRSILEFAAIILLVYGFLHEEEVANWERRTARKFLRWLKEGDQK